MQKVCKALVNVSCKVLFIGFGVQIVLGLCWLVTNMGEVPLFGETTRYLEASKSFIENGYRGILYPLLIMLAQGMEQLVRIPYHCFLYLLQLGVAFYAAFLLLQAVGVRGKWRLCYGSLAMVTVPMALQCHMAVLPDSLSASFWMLEWAYAIVCLGKQKDTSVSLIIKLCVVYLLGVALLPEFWFLGALPVLAVMVRKGVELWKNGKKRHILRLVAVGYFFMCGVIFVANVGAVERRSTGSVMASRFAWSHAIEDYRHWPLEVQKCISPEDVLHIAGYADNVDRVLAEKLEACVGEERAEELLLATAKASFERQTKQNAKEILWDVYGYVFAPWMLQNQLQGGGYESYSGRNYELMGMHTPRLANDYMTYGSCFFVLGLFLATGLQVAVWWKKKDGMGKRILFLVLTGCLCPVLYYSLRGAGMMDYKKTICVLLLWILWMQVRSDDSRKGAEMEGVCDVGIANNQIDGGIADHTRSDR